MRALGKKTKKIRLCDGSEVIIPYGVAAKKRCMVLSDTQGCHSDFLDASSPTSMRDKNR